MKQLTTALVAATVSFALYAEGYQVNTFSAKQEGMGHTGVALKLGSESQIFNPAAVSFMDKTMQISGGLSAIKATGKATYNGTTYETNNDIATPLNISAAFRIYDNLYAGVTFYTPYGSSINWGKSWPGAALNQSVDLKVYTVQPTISWRITDKLAIGAGLMVSWGSVNLNKGLVDASTMDALLGLQYEASQLQYKAAQLQSMVTGSGDAGEAPTASGHTYGNVTPASVNLQGKSELALGFNVGAFYDINNQWSVGASFRSKMQMHVKAGDVNVEYADEQARALLGSTLENLDYTNFDASMPCPYVLTFGVSYKPIKRLTLALDAQLNGWKTYKQLDMTFANQEAFDQHLTKNYRNAWTFHLGGEFAMTRRLDLRAGLMVDCNPCNFSYYNPETPGTTKFEPSVGLSFRPIEGLSIDVAFMYVYGKKVNQATGQFDNFLAKSYNSYAAQLYQGADTYNTSVAQINAAMGTQLPSYTPTSAAYIDETTKFTADYKVHAIIPAIGISYSF